MRDYLFDVVSAVVVGVLFMSLIAFSVSISALGNNQRHFSGNHSTCNHK